jgi:carbonic anhydrase
VISSDELLRSARAGTGRVDPKPRRRLAIVTCMDTRINAFDLFGAGRGEVHVIQNAGGVINRDVIRSLAISQRVLGTIAVDVMMHTDCGMLGLDETELEGEIAASGGDVGTIGGFTDVREELHKGVERLRSARELTRRDRIRGLLYDVNTSVITTIVPI